MKSQITINLSDLVLNDLKLYASKLNISYQKLVETAVANFIEELKRQEYINSFRIANRDKELISFAEEGINDLIENPKTQL